MSSTRSPAKSATPPSAPSSHPDMLVSPAQLSRFDLAVARAQARYTIEQWMLLEPGTRIATIYAE